MVIIIKKVLEKLKDRFPRSSFSEQVDPSECKSHIYSLEIRSVEISVEKEDSINNQQKKKRKEENNS